MQDNRPRQITTNPNVNMKPISTQQQQQQQVKINNQLHQHFPIPNIPQRNSNIDRIYKQIKHVDYINRQLLNVAEKVKSIGPMNNMHTNNPVIDRIQNDLKGALNELIQNIMQFFKDIDAKLKNLGLIVNNQLHKQA